MSGRPRLWAELCCGSAAVTLRLLGGRYARPPISYMGAKTGYAGAILAALGLRSGIGADRVVLCDAGPWAHVYAVLADPSRCAEVATILRGWADEDPRALWERLREEHRGEWDGWTSERAAGWLTSATWAHRRGHPESGFNVGVAYRSEFKASNGDVGSRPPETTEMVAHRVESVAAWLQVGAMSNVGGNLDAGRLVPFQHPTEPWRMAQPKGKPENLARKIVPIAAPLAIYAGNAADVPIPDDCDGVYCLIDPPYHGVNGTEKITGYAHDLPRTDLLTLLQRWSDAGAVVCCCECVGLAGELPGRWWEVDVTGARVGSARTFSRQSTEVLTMNREPAHVPAVQTEMFG